MFTHNFDPVLIDLYVVEIRWYSLAYIFGILVGWFYAKKIIKRLKNDSSLNDLEIKDFDDLIPYLVIGIILGGRLGYVLIYNFDYYIKNLHEIFYIWNGGMSFHGGLIGIIVTTIIFASIKKIHTFIYLDVISCVAPIGLFLGRISNFINGELYGRQTDVYWAMVFPRGGQLPRHPSQLYEAGLEGFLLFFCISVVVFRFQGLERPGLVSGVFMTGYGIFRYLVEFYREPDSHLGTIYGIATMGQLLSVPLILIGISLIYLAWHRT